MTIIEQLAALVDAARPYTESGGSYIGQNFGKMCDALDALPHDWEQQLRAMEADTRERCAVIAVEKIWRLSPDMINAEIANEVNAAIMGSK